MWVYAISCKALAQLQICDRIHLDRGTRSAVSRMRGTAFAALALRASLAITVSETGGLQSATCISFFGAPLEHLCCKQREHRCEHVGRSATRGGDRCVGGIRKERQARRRLLGAPVSRGELRWRSTDARRSRRSRLPQPGLGLQMGSAVSQPCGGPRSHSHDFRRCAPAGEDGGLRIEPAHSRSRPSHGRIPLYPLDESDLLVNQSTVFKTASTFQASGYELTRHP